MASAEMSSFGIYMIMLGMLLTGTANTIILKLQNGQTSIIDGTYYPEFNHPYIQGAIMFVGEICCMGVYRLFLWREKKQYGDLVSSPAYKEAEKKGLKTNINPVLLAIPAFCDLAGSTLQNIALTMIAASIYQMMRGLIVFVVAIMSILFLKAKLYRHHWTALVLILLGISSVGVSAIVYDDESDDPWQTRAWRLLGEGAGGGSAALGIIFIVASQFMHGLFFIVEEKLLGDYYLHPLFVVGWEGVWGFLIYIVLLIPFQFISCGGTMCPPERNGKLEDTVLAFKQMGNNIGLLFLIFGMICSISCFNAFGVSVTKYASSAQRSVVDTTRTVLIWMFFLIY